MDLIYDLTDKRLSLKNPYITPAIFFDDRQPHYTIQDINDGLIGLDTEKIYNTRPEVFELLYKRNTDDSLYTDDEFEAFKKIYNYQLNVEIIKPIELIRLFNNRIHTWHLKTLDEKCFWFFMFWSSVPVELRPLEFKRFSINVYQSIFEYIFKEIKKEHGDF